ncbi:MAG: cytochrome c-type biogenesis protein CcmH [Acidobacteria bacterium]|nr:cytochrome c-type biogenesis protein CcmH [Acidobacteriota bacterium]
MKSSIMCSIGAIILAAALPAAPSFSAQSTSISEKAREIEDLLIAPCCWTQPVSQHYSEEADAIRKEVREMLAAGKSRDEILDYYVSQYGERILAVPRPRGFYALVFVLPWVALITGAWLLVILLKKLRAPAAAPAPSPLPDSRYSSVIEKEMKDLEE